MGELAITPMSLGEFLCWDDGSDRHFELIDGFPVAMVPPARAHGMLCARLAGLIDAGLRSRRPCAAQTEAGIASPDRDDSFYVADIAVSCGRTSAATNSSRPRYCLSKSCRPRPKGMTVRQRCRPTGISRASRKSCCSIRRAPTPRRCVGKAGGGSRPLFAEPTPFFTPLRRVYRF